MDTGIAGNLTKLIFHLSPDVYTKSSVGLCSWEFTPRDAVSVVFNSLQASTQEILAREGMPCDGGSS
jgi:hypothetical protein